MQYIWLISKYIHIYLYYALCVPFFVFFWSTLYFSYTHISFIKYSYILDYTPLFEQK